MSGTNTLTDEDISSGKPITGPDGFGLKTKNMFDDIYGILASFRIDQIKNGSFEACSLGDGKTPDNWDVSDYPGGSHSLDSSNPQVGKYALAFVHPGGVGNGGGYAETDYYDCSTKLAPNTKLLTFSWWHKCNNSVMKNLFYVRFYDKDKIWISDEILWCNLDTGALGSAATYRWYCGTIMPPSNAIYYKLRIVGGESSVNQAGTSWFDDIQKLDARPSVLDIGLTANSAAISYAPEFVYSDIITVPLPMMFSTAERLSLSVSGYFDVYSYNNDSTGVRFRIGSNYSNAFVFSPGDNAWHSGLLTLDVLNFSPGSKYQPIVIQGSTNTTTSNVRKSSVSTKFVIASNLGLPDTGV